MNKYHPCIDFGTFQANMTFLMHPNGAAPRSVLVGMILSALNKLNYFILLDRLL